MPLFKVEANKAMWPKDFNPFRLRSAELMNGKVKISVKTWQFEAKNKKEVERLWQEAQDNGVTEVFGYKLGTITQLDA
jgi:hypothetical protein